MSRSKPIALSLIAMISAFAFFALALDGGRSRSHASWKKTTNTPLIKQEDDSPNWYGCGAATAKMILDSAPVGGETKTLAELRAAIEAHRAEPPGSPGGGFYTDPVAEEWVLNEYDDAYWVIYDDTDVTSAAGKLAYTLDHYGTPSATLVFNGNHWIVVTGIQTSVQPSTGCFEVERVLVNDPEDPKSLWISYAIWSTNCQTANQWGVTYLNKYVSVCDPDPPPACVLIPSRPTPCGALRNLEVDCPLSEQDAYDLAPQLIVEEELTSEFAGLVIKGAARVGISHTSDTAWWVGYGPDDGTSQVCAGVLIDDDQADFLLACWDNPECFVWEERTQHFPYLHGGRRPTASESTNQSGLFYIHGINARGSCALNDQCVPLQTPCDCAEAGGIYQGDQTSCSGIPTVSGWGLFFLALLLMAAGIIITLRRLRLQRSA